MPEPDRDGWLHVPGRRRDEEVSSYGRVEGRGVMNQQAEQAPSFVWIPCAGSTVRWGRTRPPEQA